MDNKLNYQDIIKRILLKYAEYFQYAGVNLHQLFDDNHNSYMLLNIGWHNKKYIHRATLHLEIIAGKIWIHTDDTEDGIAEDLLKLGVPKEDIVLGFKPPSMRLYTGFAVA